MYWLKKKYVPDGKRYGPSEMGASGKLVVNDDRNDSPFSRDRRCRGGGVERLE